MEDKKSDNSLEIVEVENLFDIEVEKEISSEDDIVMY